MTTQLQTGENFYGMDGALWIQPDGPNTDLFYLGCHALGDVTRPKGDTTQYYCPDPSGAGRYRLVGKTKAPPGLITLSVETDVRFVKDYLEGLDCPGTLMVTHTKSGKKDRSSNWLRAEIFPGFDVTSETLSNLAAKDSNDRSMFSVDANADDVITVFPLKVYRQSTSEVNAINSIFACDEDLCQTQFSASNKRCTTLYATADAGAGATANVLKKVGTGAWTSLATSPFAINENVQGGVCFAVDNLTGRVLVFRGNTGASSFAVNSMRASYSDDDGVTWTSVTIGSDVGEILGSPRAVFALDFNHIWIGSDSGRIYFSADGGVTWTTQEDAVIQVGAWNWVEFIDNKVGFAGGAGDEVAITVDGGNTWSEVTATGGGDDILSGKVFNANQAWVFTSGGDAYFTNDGGTTWSNRTSFPKVGTGSVVASAWSHQQVGVLAWKSVGNITTFYFTKDGGVTWEEITTPTNGGVNNMMACNAQLFYAVGEASGGTGVIYELKPSA